MSGLCQILCHYGLMSKEEAALYQTPPTTITTVIPKLLEQTKLTSELIAKTCAKHFGLPLITQPEFNTILQLNKQIFNKIYLKEPILPIQLYNQTLTIAIADPDHFLILDNIRFTTNLDIKACFIAYDTLWNIRNQLNGLTVYQNAIQQQKTNDDSTTIIHLVEQTLLDAITLNASDIHYEMLQLNCRIRLRVDGVLQTLINLPNNIAPGIISRLKIMANLDIAQKRIPQDGRFSFDSLQGFSRDCRLSTCPTLHGEKAVVRILNKNNKLLNIDDLGMSLQQRNIFLTNIKKPQGLILVTGPTGSGKTITLYTALSILNNSEKNISTIEDPIEIDLPGINQININNKAGLSFATTLRALLRQDPDIIMVGEIRDKETADIAIRASLTGHLVLATLHTNSAVETITRLLNMGVSAYNLASAVTCIIAQRLLRKIEGDGYSGRTGIYEILSVNEKIKNLMSNGKSAAEILQLARHQGMQTLLESARNKINAHITNEEEVLRVLN